MKTERRYLAGAELRASGGNRISGYAAVFNSLSEDLGGFRENINPGAFARAIREKQDVRCLFNHDNNFVLGRTKSGTLRVSEDSVGLHFDCDLPDTMQGQNLRELIRRGDVSQCSFGFLCRDDQWSEEAGEARRRLLDCDLLDVSPVTYAAYSETSVSARSLWPDGAPAGVARHRAGDVAGCYQLRAGGLIVPTRDPREERELLLGKITARIRLNRITGY
jgi:HK97 family phage prohead protease